MKKVKVLWLLLAIFIFSFGLAKAAPSEKELLSKVSEYFEYISNRDFENASKLFYYPDHYSHKFLLKDMDGVAGMLAILDDEFGNLERYVLYENSDYSVWQIGVFGGDVSDFTKDMPKTIKLIYEAQFEHENNVYIFFYFLDNNELLKIRAMSYALHSNQPINEVKYTKIMERLSSFVIESINNK